MLLARLLLGTVLVSAVIVIVGLGHAVLNVLAPTTVVFAIAVALYAVREDDNHGGGLMVLGRRSFSRRAPRETVET